MPLSRKDYELIASSINSRLAVCQDAGDTAGRNALIALAEALSRANTRENPRFDTDRFMAACGLS